MRVIFMGTPEFAVASLEVLHDRKDDVVLVVSQQDKPKGRGKKLVPTPVKQKALEYGYEVYQPQKVKDAESIALLISLEPDVIVVTAYGQILSQELLNIPKYGCINVHASLLPKYRGAAPIQFALLHGEQKTGITTMMMDVGLDTGDMLVKEEVELTEDDTLSTLSKKLMDAGQIALHKTLEQLEQYGREIPREKQNDEDSCYASMLTREMGYIDWSKTAREIKNQIRAVEGWPSAVTFYRREKVKLFQVEITPEESKGIAPGTISEVTKKHLKVATGDVFVKIFEVQFPNKKRMEVSAYLLGNTIEEGEIFTVSPNK